MRKIYSSLLVLLLMAVSTVAKAQSFEGTVDSYPESNWFSGYVEWSAAEVAAAAGFADTQSFIDAYNAWEWDDEVGPNHDEDKKLFYYGDNDYNYTQETHGGYWFSAEGDNTGYVADEKSFYVATYIDDEGDEPLFGFSLGQMPGTYGGGESCTVTIYLKNGDKIVPFTIHFNVLEKPKSDLPEPTTSLSALNIVKDYTLTLSFKENNTSDGTFSVMLDGVYDALGTTVEQLDPFAGDLTYAQGVTADETGDTYFYNDELELAWGETDGWFGRYTSWDEAAAEEIQLDMNAFHYWGAGATFYLHDIALENGEFSVFSGQFVGTMAPDDSDWTYIYLIVGDKAARIKVVAEVQEAEKVPFDQMEKVGEQNLVAVSEIGDYREVAVDFNLADVLEKLGCDVADILEWNFQDEASIVDPTLNDYWQSEEGYSQSWFDKPCAKVYPTDFELSNGSFTLMQMAGVYGDIEEEVGPFPIKYILSYGDKYYQINIAYTVKPAETWQGEYTREAVESLSIQIVPSDDWAWGTTSVIDLEYVETKIGTRNFVLYTDAYDENEEALVWSKNYTCTPYPGFWYGIVTYTDGNGNRVVDNAGFGDNSFGMTYANGVITWYQIPNLRIAGDYYTANVYLANEENGKYVQYILNVSYVEEVTPDTETVLNKDFEIEVTEDNFKDYIVTVDIDTEELYKALGLSDELLESATFSVARSATSYEQVNTEEDFMLNADGYIVQDETTEELVASAHFSIENGLQLIVDPYLDFEKGSEDKIVVRFVVEYDAKRAVCVMTMLAQDSPLSSSIAGTASVSEPSTYYNISGARLTAPTKGLNIIRHNNGAVEKVFVK